MLKLVYDKLGTPNASKCKGVRPFDTTLPGLLDLIPNCYVKKSLRNTSKKSISYYHIVPHDPHISFGCKGSGFMDFISPLALTRLQDSQDGLNLLIYFPWEGFNLQFKKYSLIKYINSIITKYYINRNKIFFCFGDINIKESLLQSPVELDLPDKNILGLNIFQWVANGDRIRTKSKPSSKIFLNRKKKFLCKNGVARPQRMYLAGALHNKKLLDKFYFSWLNHTKWDYNNSIRYAFSQYNNGEKNIEFLSSFIEFIKDEPYILDISSKEATIRSNQIITNSNLYNNSYASLVTETVVDSWNQGVLFITEKTYQPIYNLHPFIIVGGSGILEVLKNNGYATFPELFDEDYDKIKDCSTRIKKILIEVEKFSKMDTKFLDDIYSSTTFRDKLMHNLSNFKSKTGEDEIKKLLFWLVGKDNTDYLI